MIYKNTTTKISTKKQLDKGIQDKECKNESN